MELIARYLLNVICGSLLTFLMSYLLISLIRPLIKNYRTLYFLYLLPLMKITYDLFFMNHSHWGFLYGKEILKASPNSRTLNAYVGIRERFFSGISLEFTDGKTFSLGDLGAEILGPYFMGVLAVCLLAVTCFFLSCWFSHLYQALRWQKQLPLKEIFPGIYSTSFSLKSPIAIGFWKPRIVISHYLLETLTSQEIKAVCQHEKEHHLWKDNLLSTLCNGLLALFWFIPFKKRLLKNASFYRELACDLKSETPSIVGALCKISISAPPLASLAFSSSDRIAWLLHKKPPGKIAMILSCMIFIGGSAFIFISTFLPF